jgi:Gas vesicle synthesis protein GvpL/GvpF
VSEAAAAWYVYGVVSSTTQPEGTGVAARTVELVPEGGVAALASAVPADEFDEESLRERLDDRAWLERTAREHEEALERTLAVTAVIPFRLCTVYETRDRLREFLSAHGPALANLLARLDGRVELGVKAYFAAQPPDRDEPQSGREYLLRRQREREAAEEAARFKVECARTSHERLAAAAEEARANPPQPPELSGRTEDMLLNGAYLLRRDEGGLTDAVAELEALYGPRGVTYEITGPWPPYNFVPPEIVGT